jgi:hypothetical protein
MAITAGAGLVVVVAVAALILHRPSRPSASEIRKYIEKSFDEKGCDLTGLSSSSAGAEKDNARVTYHAVLSLRQPLYESLDVSRYLSAHFGLDPATSMQVHALATGKRSPHILEKAKIASFSDPLENMVLLQERVPAGKEISADGALDAILLNDGWHFQEPERPEYSGTSGAKPKSAFAGKVYIIDEAGDRAQVKSLVGAETDLLAKLKAAQAAYLAEIRANTEKIKAHLYSELSPGSLFSGAATAGKAPSVRLFLEIHTFEATTGQIDALLRNDGSWSDTRAFRGHCDFNESEGTLDVTLSTQIQDALAGGGPMLGESADWTIVLELDDSRLTGASSNGAWQYDFNRLAEADAVKQKEELQSNEAALVAATSPGTVYRGRAMTEDRVSGFDCVLRFLSTPEGGTAAATLELAHHGDEIRSFAVKLIANRYRAKDRPIRLETKPAADIWPSNDNRSPIAYPDPYAIMLKLEDGRLVGESEAFRFRFERAAADYVAQLDAEKAVQAKKMFSFAKEAASYDGVFRSTDGDRAEKFRLTFRRVDQDKGKIEATLYPLDFAGVYAHMKGVAIPSESEIQLERADWKSVAGRRLQAPIFAWADDALILDLILKPAMVFGEVRGDPWKAEIPLLPFAYSGGAAVADLNACPKAPGGYAWIDAKWVPLPHNNGHTTRVAKRVMAGVFGFFSRLVRKTSDVDSQGSAAVADLAFDGTDSIPSADTNKVVIVFVGPTPSFPDDVLADHPELRDYPAIEMAPAVADGDRVRKAPLFRIGPSLDGFVNTRVPAVVEKITDHVTMLACTQPVVPGGYAILAGTDSFELKVR